MRDHERLHRRGSDRRLRRPLFASVALLGATLTADAATTEDCEHLAAALRSHALAEDWRALDQGGNEYISRCSRIVEGPEASAGHRARVLAHAGRDRQVDRLAAAEVCLAIRARDAVCLVERTAALDALDRREDARIAAAMARGVLQQSLAERRAERAAAEAFERRRLDVELGRDQAQLDRLRLIELAITP